MKRLKIYFVHSTKFDYNNLLYKRVLASKVCLEHNLILPMTKDNQVKYAKDLLNAADIIIVEVSHPSFGLSLELKWLKKLNKPKLFLSLDNKIPRRYKRLVPEIVPSDINSYIKIIEDFIKKNSEVEEEKKEEIITLGEL